MRKNELATLLRTVADLIESHGLRNVQQKLNDMSGGTSNYENSQRETGELGVEGDDYLKSFVQWVDQASLKEITERFEKDENLVKGDAVRSVSRMLGLSPGRRQSREALIQSLISHLDRKRMHRVISGRNRNSPNDQISLLEDDRSSMQENPRAEPHDSPTESTKKED
ncbi:hypothetical protein [Xanthomonas phaseoli]|uniref:Uncharacterized protein n=1 Tax=Xanthomonas manihotis TaxID=43353 RepID=A0A8I2BU95_XANMN|nr:hypothetical protein [Xanthomonas phaseoli]MBO9722708.1 hypothetical protein [Xanthomonas phaseoli pv. manihotis]MBO9759027.1 hypothetical protein [Xanthomonas phaseoli pv. manihotis]MBO9783703.1 hypothetical protein [Xanthomonas phaseoli pv. manihotis]